MKIIKAAPAALGLLLAATPALYAQDAGPDVDGDGLVSMEEFAAAYPDLAADTFTLADTNADGALDEAEIAAAAEAGLMPMNET